MKIKNIFKSLVIMALLLMIMGAPAFSQQIKNPKKFKEPFWDRVYFGGNFGFQFGTYTYINVSPEAAYKVTDNFFAGIGFTYQYIKDKRYYPYYSTNAYGGKLFARYYVWRDLFAQAEYDPLYLTYYDYYYDATGNYIDRIKQSTWVHDILLGGGYRQWMGNKAYVSLEVMFNINESLYSPYRNPIIRIGFGVGL
jgi:hypothetical protein